MEKLFVYLTDLSSGVAYAIIFGILLACGLGFPLPEDIPLVAAGYLVWEGTLKWFPALLVTMAGVLIGDSILFFLGQRLGLSILKQERFQKIFAPKSESKNVLLHFIIHNWKKLVLIWVIIKIEDHFHFF